MGLSATVKSTRIQNDHVVSSPPAFYTADTHTIFTITGGPVWIKAMIEYMDAGMTNVTTSTLTICGVGMDAGPVAIGASDAGSVVVSPLYVVPKLAAAPTLQIPAMIALGAPNNAGLGVVAGLRNGGLIRVTFATAMAVADRWSLHIVYQKLASESLIS